MAGRSKDLDSDYVPKNLWDRLPYESARAYGAFRIYLTTPSQERGYQVVADKMKCSYANISRWGHMYTWQERANAYDGYIAREQDEQVIEEVATIQDALIIREQADIEKLHAIWQRQLDNVQRMVDSPDPERQALGMSVIGRMVRVRGDISILERRAARMPIAYKPEQSDDTGLPDDMEYVTSWKEGPKPLLPAPKGVEDGEEMETTPTTTTP